MDAPAAVTGGLAYPISKKRCYVFVSDLFLGYYSALVSSRAADLRGLFKES